MALQQRSSVADAPAPASRAAPHPPLRGTFPRGEGGVVIVTSSFFCLITIIPRPAAAVSIVFRLPSLVNSRKGFHKGRSRVLIRPNAARLPLVAARRFRRNVLFKPKQGLRFERRRSHRAIRSFRSVTPLRKRSERRVLRRGPPARLSPISFPPKEMGSRRGAKLFRPVLVPPAGETTLFPGPAGGDGTVWRLAETKGESAETRTIARCNGTGTRETPHPPLRGTFSQEKAGRCGGTRNGFLSSQNATQHRGCILERTFRRNLRAATSGSRAVFRRIRTMDVGPLISHLR